MLLLFFGLTTFGRGVRSIIQDETGARLVGINPSFVRTVIFALSGALAGIVAITQSMSGPPTVNAGFELTTFALIVTVVGGLGSVAGAFLAGVLLGVVEHAERPLHRAIHHDDHPPRRGRPDHPDPPRGLLGRGWGGRGASAGRSCRSSQTAAILVILPSIWFGDSPYTTSLAVQALVFAAYGVGFNLIFGCTNQLFLCVGALAGIGGYTAR